MTVTGVSTIPELRGWKCELAICYALTGSSKLPIQSAIVKFVRVAAFQGPLFDIDVPEALDSVRERARACEAKEIGVLFYRRHSCAVWRITIVGLSELAVDGSSIMQPRHLAS